MKPTRGTGDVAASKLGPVHHATDTPRDCWGVEVDLRRDGSSGPETFEKLLARSRGSCRGCTHWPLNHVCGSSRQNVTILRNSRNTSDTLAAYARLPVERWGICFGTVKQCHPDSRGLDHDRE